MVLALEHALYRCVLLQPRQMMEKQRKNHGQIHVTTRVVQQSGVFLQKSQDQEQNDKSRGRKVERTRGTTSGHHVAQAIVRRPRLGGILNFYQRAAA